MRKTRGASKILCISIINFQMNMTGKKNKNDSNGEILDKSGSKK